MYNANWDNLKILSCYEIDVHYDFSLLLAGILLCSYQIHNSNPLALQNQCTLLFKFKTNFFFTQMGHWLGNENP